MKKINLILSALLFILVGCSRNSELPDINEFSTDKAAYFIHQYSGGVFGQKNQFNFIDEKGQTTKLIEIDTTSDLSDDNYNFDSNTNYFYQYGPGGLFEIDLLNQTVTCITKKYANILIFDDNDNIYYYENNGFKDNFYDARVCTREQDCIQFVQPIFALGYEQGLLYVSMSEQNQEGYFIEVFDKGKKVKSIEDTKFCSMFDRIKDDFYCYNITSLFRMEENEQVALPFVDEFDNPISLKANLPYIKEINGEILLIDTSSKFIYNMNIEEDKTVLKVIKDVGHGYYVYPSFEENFVVLGNPNFGFKKLNLITLEVEDIQFNYSLDDPNMRISTVIPIK